MLYTHKAKLTSPSIVVRRKSFIKLYNENNEVVDSIECVTTNDFGSYSAKFTLPANLLNGDFRIEDDKK